jgi:hypothetical protein
MPKIAISLGKNCNPAVWGVKNGLRKTKANGYNTCPFDLMVSNYKGVVECIKDDFKHFCDSNYLKSNSLKNTYYGFGFNHEDGTHKQLWLKEKWAGGKGHFIANNFKNFKERYNTRIQSFRNYLNDKNNYIIFLILLKDEQKQDKNLKELRDVLKLKYPNLKYEIKILN